MDRTAKLAAAVAKAAGAKPVEWVPVAEEGDVTWFLVRLSDGRWAATDDAEIAPDRVEVYATREEAEKYLSESWEEVQESCEAAAYREWLREYEG